MQWKDIEKLVKDNWATFQLLEEYDRTGHLPTERIRRSFTLQRATYEKLQSLSREKKKPMSRVIDELVAQC